MDSHNEMNRAKNNSHKLLDHPKVSLLDVS